MIRWAWAFAVACCLSLADAPLTRAQSLSEEQATVLSLLDQDEAAQVLAIVARIAEAREQLQAAQATLTTAAAEPDAAAALAYYNLLAQLVKSAGGLPEEVQAALTEVQELRAALAEAQAAWRDAPFDAAAAADQTEAEFRKELRARIMAERAAILGEQGERVLAAIEGMGEPAQFLKNYVQQEISAWLQEKRTVGDWTFQIVQVDPSRPLFGEDANIRVRVEYAEGVTVEAEGLYFRYSGGSVEPVLDPARMKIDDGGLRNSLVNQALSSLGQLIPADLGMGIKVTDFQFLGFAPAGPKQKPGGLQLTVECALGDVLPKLNGENMVLYPDGDFDPGTLGFSLPAQPGTPIGTTGLGYYGISGAYAPTERKLTAGTLISTFPGDPKAMALDVQLSVDFPVTQLGLAGTVQVADGSVKVADATATLDFASREIRGTFDMPSSKGSLPIGDFLTEMHGDFRLNQTGCYVNGSMAILGQDCAQAQLEMLFNGHGTLTAQGGFDILGAEAAASLYLAYTPGFSSITLDATVSVDVPIEPWGEVSCTVRVTADSQKNPPIHVATSAFGQAIEFDVVTFDALTLGLLAEQIGPLASDMYHNVLNTLAQGESDVRDWGEQLDTKTRNWAAERARALGVDKFETGIPALDRFGGDVSVTVQNAGGALHDVTQELGGVVSGAREGVQGVIKSGGDRVSNVLGIGG